MKKKKKIIVLVSFCLLLILTGTVNVLINNYALTEASKAESNAVVVGNFFTNYREDRVETRAEEKLYLEAIIASENVSAEAKANAEAQLELLLETQNNENVMERLILAKGFADAVISSSNGNISVTSATGCKIQKGVFDNAVL